jgi:hypothetical protein
MPTQSALKRTPTESLAIGLEHHQANRLTEAERLIIISESFCRNRETTQAARMRFATRWHC